MTPRNLSARALSLTLALAAGLAGCDEGGPIAGALDDAQVRLTALNPNGGASASEEYQRTVYNQVVAGLQDHAGTGTPSQNAAAYILMARAQTGLGIAPAQQAADTQEAIQHSVMLIRTELGRYESLSAQAEALAAYDPAPELNEIARQSQEKDSQIQQEQARKAEIDARVADLRNQAASKAAAAKAKRQEEGGIRQTMSGVSAVEGETLLREAVAIGRQADALDGESADLTARAAQVAPQSDQVQLKVDEYTAQRALLDRARDEVNQRAQNIAARAAAARSEASKAAGEIQTLVAAVVEARGALTYDEARQQFQAAAATAKKASSDAGSRASAELAHGVAQQSLGDVYWSQAHGLAMVAAMYDALTSADPALPDMSAYKARLDEARAARQEALTGATEAYTAAAQSFKGAGVSGESRERLDSVVQRLAAAVKTTSHGEKDLAAELGLEGAAEESDTGGEPVDGGDSAAVEPGSPGESIAAVLAAIKADDYRTAIEYLHAEDPALRGLVDAAGRIAEKAVSLDTAMKDAFGEGLEAAMAGNQAALGPAAAMDPSEFENLTVADFPVEVSGDTGVVRSPAGMEGPNDGLLIRRVDGVWKADLDAMLKSGMGDNPQAAQQMQAMASMFAPMADQIGQVFDDLRSGVEAGTYTSAEAVGQALNQRMQQMMQSMMGGMMPPPGGG